MDESAFRLGLDYARCLDRRDPLAPFRDRFYSADPDLVYLDGNSLGRLPQSTIERVQATLLDEWGRDLIRSWNRGWYDAPARLGAKIAQLLGAGPNQVLVSDSTTVNLFKLVAAALALRLERTQIISDVLNFPSDLYVLQGCIPLLGNRHHIDLVPSTDGISPDLDALADAITVDTALVTLSHVTFKSGYLYDMAAITERAHRSGALVLWDMSHSVGVVPVELDRWNVDMAVGCTYKHLNGGPGSPAFLYVRRELQDALLSPIWGWFGQHAPFEFKLEYQPADGIARFLVGTPPILSLAALEPALDLVLEAGLDRIRNKSLELGSYLIFLVDRVLAPLGFSLATPRTPARRGSHVSLRHPVGYRINRALIKEMDVIPDFREPDNIRLGLAPLYTSYADLWHGVDRLRRVVEERRYENYTEERSTVT
jgi:kynureninase